MRTDVPTPEKKSPRKLAPLPHDVREALVTIYRETEENANATWSLEQRIDTYSKVNREAITKLTQSVLDRVGKVAEESADREGKILASLGRIESSLKFTRALAESTAYRVSTLTGEHDRDSKLLYELDTRVEVLRGKADRMPSQVDVEELKAEIQVVKKDAEDTKNRAIVSPDQAANVLATRVLEAVLTDKLEEKREDRRDKREQVKDVREEGKKIKWWLLTLIGTLIIACAGLIIKALTGRDVKIEVPESPALEHHRHEKEH